MENSKNWMTRTDFKILNSLKSYKNIYQIMAITDLSYTTIKHKLRSWIYKKWVTDLKEKDSRVIRYKRHPDFDFKKYEIID